MTLEQQRIAIAEACGWTDISLDEPDVFEFQALIGFPPIQKAVKILVPNYTADLNACHEMEKTLFDQDYGPASYGLTLGTRRSSEGCPIKESQLWHATSAERCKSFLIVKGLWKE